jgi:ribosomal protein S18 acetylase RimI-like enzyme
MGDSGLGATQYRNYCEMWRSVGAHANHDAAFEVHERPTMLLVKSHLSQRVPHMVLDPRVPPGEERGWASALIQEWAGTPVSVMVQIPPGFEHGRLVSVLRDLGFLQGLRPSVAMARRADTVFELRSDEDIELAATDEALDEARRLLGTVFTLPANVFAFYTPRQVVRTYLLREHGLAVGAACLCPFAGAAGVYSVGVLPRARGRGYAQRLVLQMLSDAAELGFSTAVLSCDRQLIPLYRRLGFGVACDLVTYWMEALWR